MKFPVMSPYGIEDENLDAKLKELTKGNALTEHKVDDEELKLKCGVFGVVQDIADEAHDMYTEGELGWDRMCKSFAQAMTDLVGKEGALKKAYELDMEEAEDDEEDKNESEKEDDDESEKD